MENASGELTTVGPTGETVALGIEAEVSALDASGSVAGVWNWSTGSWVSGTQWLVPIGPYVTLVLETGLLSNSTLQQAMFAVILTAPYAGALGFPLYCGGC